MPETGPRAPARTLVAVRAMVPVTQMPPNMHRDDVGDALRDELAVRAVPAAGHAVGDHGRQQRLDRAEQRDREGVGQHRVHFREAESGQRRRRQRCAACRRTASRSVATSRCSAQRQRGGHGDARSGMPASAGADAAHHERSSRPTAAATAMVARLRRRQRARRCAASFGTQRRRLVRRCRGRAAP